MGHHNIPLLSVVVVSFNTATLLHDCLTSLFESTQTPSLEVLVVDNGSCDGSVEMIHSTFPEVRLIANEENLGFGVANNQAIAAARGSYVLLLNSDTIVWPGAIERLICEMEREPGLALVGPRLVGANGIRQRSASRFPTPAILLLEQLNLARLMPSMRQPDVAPDSDASISVDWLIGACLLGRRELLLAYGPFDPRFFMYGEDIDLCYRVRSAGWDIRLVPSATITHLGGRSARHDRERMAVQATKSMYLFYRKHYSGRALLQAALIFRCTAVLKSIRDLVHWGWLTLKRQHSEQCANLLIDLRVWLCLLFLRPPLLGAIHERSWNDEPGPRVQAQLLAYYDNDRPG